MNIRYVYFLKFVELNRKLQTRKDSFSQLTITLTILSTDSHIFTEDLSFNRINHGFPFYYDISHYVKDHLNSHCAMSLYKNTV